MKKLLILPMLIAMCMADFSAFAGRSSAGRSGGTSAPSTQKKTSGVRSATQQAGMKNVKPSAQKANGVRAAATQKAIKMGTKVATATENTVVSKDCQDAYYGCMDAFCMLDNASGGRCQCNDRITEFDKILDEIMRIDEQSLQYAQEGVERVQMGELADEITSRAKSIEQNYINGGKTATTSNVKTRKQFTLDTSVWNNSSIFADDDETEEKAAEDFIVDNLSDKKGDELHKAAAKICTQQIPAECKTSASMLQMAYAQKIRSDCTGYENSLKQQRSASVQKLQAAQRAVREALLEDEQNKNKYEDLGSCVVAFKQCMQTTGECGTDFGGCVADNSILSALYGKGKGGSKSSKVATTQIKTGVSTITISSATYDILQTKAQRCESVVRQCQNANGGKTVAGGKVLGEFMKDVAAIVYSTEFNMASNARMNCITTIINCVKTSCKSAGMDEGTDNYDACLSNPDSIKNYCGLEIKRCGDEASENDVISYVQAKLASDRVDKCTSEVKECLTSEDRCGEDYMNCVGMSVNQIMKLCPIDKLLACQDKFDRSDAGMEAANEYISRVITGLKLNISNGIAQDCQDAVDKAMVKVCGSVDDCTSLTLDNVQYNLLKAQICLSGTNNCYDTAESLNQADIIAGRAVPRLVNRLNINNFVINQDGKFEYKTTNLLANEGYTNKTPDDLINGLNAMLKAKIDEISIDHLVDSCINGRDLTEIFPDASENDPNRTKKFEHLLTGAKTVIANRLRTLFATKYAEKEQAAETEKFQTLYTNIADRLNSIKDLTEGDFISVQTKACEDRALSINKTDNGATSTGSWTNDTRTTSTLADADGACSVNGGFCELGSEYFFDTWWGRNERRQALYWTTASYNSATGVCTLTKKKYPCTDYRTGPEICAYWNTTGEVESTQTIQLPLHIEQVRRNNEQGNSTAISEEVRRVADVTAATARRVAEVTAATAAASVRR